MAKPNPELVRYIENNLAKGFSMKKVKARLAEAGYSADKIEDAASFVLSKFPHLAHNKHWPTIIGVFLGIVVLAAFVWFFFLKAEEVVDYQEEVVNAEVRAEYAGMSDIELIKLAAEKGEMGACEFIDDHNLYYACVDRYWERDDCSYEILLSFDVDSCYYKRAVNEKNKIFCFSISDKDSQENCFDELDQLLLKKAVSEKNLEYCQYLDLTECTLRVAFENNDVSFCANLNGFARIFCENKFISKQETIKNCNLDNLLNNFASADTSRDFLTYYPEQSCLLSHAIAYNDLSLCDEIKTKEASKMLETAVPVYEIKGFKYYSKDFPYKNFIGRVEKTPVLLPEVIFNEQRYQISTVDFCYATIAFNSKQQEICDSIQDADWKTLCITVTENEKTKCSSISDSGLKELCYLDNIEIPDDCEKLTKTGDDILTRLCRFIMDDSLLNGFP